MDSRRTCLLDAAIRVIAGSGVRALTHRAVDAEADLPVGSTSNLFRTRDALVEGVGDRLRELDLETFASFGAPAPATLDDIAQQLAEFVLLSIREHSVAARARFALAAERPAVLAEHHRWFLETATAQLDALGAQSPRLAAVLVMALVDGLTLHESTVRAGGAPPATAHLARAVRALIG